MATDAAAACCSSAEPLAMAPSTMNTQATAVTNRERDPTLKVCVMVAAPFDDSAIVPRVHDRHLSAAGTGGTLLLK
jgi:hypothetical protein